MTVHKHLKYLLISARNIPTAVSVSPPEDEQVLLSASPWFHYTENPLLFIVISFVIVMYCFKCNEPKDPANSKVCWSPYSGVLKTEESLYQLWLLPNSHRIQDVSRTWSNDILINEAVSTADVEIHKNVSTEDVRCIEPWMIVEGCDANTYYVGSGRSVRKGKVVAIYVVNV
jgi:hypothetical protein